MATAISGPRVKVGKNHGGVRVTRGGKLLLIGYLGGTLTIATGGYALIIGMVERLVVEQAGKATHRGYCRGDVINGGGGLTVTRGAVIDGTVHGRISVAWIQGRHRSSTARWSRATMTP